MPLDYETEYTKHRSLPEVPDIQARWAKASDAYRAEASVQLDQAYGPGERQRYDLFRPKGDVKDVPLAVYIHGGYWQRGSKEIFACLSEGPLARGWSAALCGYTLAPEASLTKRTS